MIIVIIALHEHLATSTYPSSSSPTQQMSTSSTYLLVNVIVVTSPSSSCFRCSPPWTWSSSDHPTQRKLLKISKECENMGPALPSGANHSRFSEGKEYRGAADPEKAWCHLNERRGHFVPMYQDWLQRASQISLGTTQDKLEWLCLPWYWKF